MIDALRSGQHAESNDPALVGELRLRSLVAYLRELHGLRFPPVRNVRLYNDLCVDASKVANDVPGVRFDPQSPAWLVVDLPKPPSEPDPPADLVSALTPRLFPLVRPVLRTDLDVAPEERDSITHMYLQWITSRWEPWELAYRRCERGRQLYLELFSAYDRLDADRDSIELVWGFGRVRWKTFGIDHPIVVVPAEINYDAGAARLSVIQSGPAEVTTGFLSGISLIAPEQLNEACKSLETAGFDPWQPNVVTQELAPLLRMMSNNSPAEGGPSLDDEWLLYVRRRPSGYLSFLQSLDENLGSLAGLPPLAALIAADPHHGESHDGTGAAPDSPLFPLPANEEQRLILRYAPSASGVTVEGPPGTGKSHTIANLICAFIAQGKRVLVTAEKEQALNVLIDKLPDAVKPLCVPVLGSGQQERLRLEHSIDRISQAAFGLAEYDATVIARLDQDLDKIRRTEASALNELRRQREAERSPLPPKTPREAGTTLAELGAWLHRQEAELGYIPDPITLDTNCPLSPTELDELSGLIANISESDETAALLPLPEPEKLPDSTELIAATAERTELIATLDDHHTDIDLSVVPNESPTDLRDLAGQLRTAAKRLEHWTGRWQGRLGLAVRDDAILGMWRSFVDQLTQGRTTIMALRAQVQAHDIALPGQGPLDHDATAALRAAHERLRSRGRLGFGHRAGRRILEQCRIDGQTPRTAEHVGLMLAESELRRSRGLLTNLLTSERVALDLPTAPIERPEDLASTLLPELSAVLEWRSSLWLQLRDRAAAAGAKVPVYPDTDTLYRLADTVDAVAGRIRVSESDDEHEQLVSYLSNSPHPQHSPMWEELARALETENWHAWGSAYAEVCRLYSLTSNAGRLRRLLDRLGALVPQWAASARATGGASLGSGSLLDRAWQWRQLATWFEQTTAGREPSEVEVELRHLAKQRLKLVADLVAAKAWTAVVGRIDDSTQRALGVYKNANARAQQRFSKFAPMYQRQLRTALDKCRHAVPVWIMTVERVLADFRCESKPPFDVLIVDEASQIPLTRLPVLGLAGRVIIVGDDKQMSPATPGVELQPTFDLLRTHLDGVPGADTTFHVNASLYDVALTRFPRRVKLTEHFRCLTEIISFSNSRYYGNALVPLRDQLPSPGWVPTQSVFVSDGYRDDDDYNRPEAEYATALIAALIKRPEYAGKTFGVISLLGKNQSKLIHDLLFDRLGPVVMSERRIRVGEPAILQGDERDIIIISTVVSDSANRRIGAMTRRDHQQMINVAASRARDQLWVLHSVSADAFPRNDERAALIRHCTRVHDATETFDQLERLIDDRSPFERDVLRALIDRGYRTIRPQYPVGRYCIDFVIKGPHTRLALECDGDRFHGPDQWDADRARQEVLERAGWTFVRVRGSGFYRNPTRALQPLWEKLDELDIPTGDWRGGPVPFELDLDLQKSASKTNETPAVTVPDDGEAASTQARAPSIVHTTNPQADAWGAAFSAADKALRRRSELTDKVDDHSD
ncbi:MAG: DUF559 domain-containing protein [Chloroflexi bacterium]|nr:DUF559 domain-containing protein [Chloroflexota bacterium]